MSEAILTRKGGMDASDATAGKPDILAGKSAYINDSDDVQIGTMSNNGAVNATLSVNGNYTIPAGYHNGSGKVTQSIPIKGAATYKPSAFNQTIAAGQYLSGAQTISGDTNLVSANIKAGVNLFGITGKNTVVDTEQSNAQQSDILDKYVAFVKGVPIAGILPNFRGITTHINYTRINNNRFEVAVERGFHNCSWADDSYEYLELNEVAALLELYDHKIIKGNTICGVAGTAEVGKQYSNGIINGLSSNQEAYLWDAYDGEKRVFLVPITGLSFTPSHVKVRVIYGDAVVGGTGYINDVYLTQECMEIVELQSWSNIVGRFIYSKHSNNKVGIKGNSFIFGVRYPEEGYGTVVMSWQAWE